MSEVNNNVDVNNNKKVVRIEKPIEGIEGQIGKTTIESVFTVDEKGNEHLSEETIFEDYNDDGKADKICKRKYDEKGRLTESLLDNNADGKYDSAVYNEYDDVNHAFTMKFDIDNDTKIDRISRYERDDKGNRVIKHDNDADGVFDSVIYPKTSQELLKELDRNHDGKVTADEVTGDVYYKNEKLANYDKKVLEEIANKDGDPNVSPEEYEQWVTSKERGKVMIENHAPDVTKEEP